MLLKRSEVLSEEMLLKQSTDLACWLLEQNFRPLTSVKGWRMVELQPRVLCFISQLTWILISRCISPSNLLFSGFIWRNVAQTVNRFGFWLWPFKQIFWLIPLLKDGGWLNCCPGCFVSYHNLLEFWYPIAELPLLHCSSVLSVKMLLELSTNEFVDRSSSKNGSLRLIMALEGIASQWMQISRLNMMGWHQIKQRKLWKSKKWSL